jgi:hypothetical protein
MDKDRPIRERCTWRLLNVTKLLVMLAAPLIALGVSTTVVSASATVPTVTLSPTPAGGPPGSYRPERTISVSVGPNSFFKRGTTIRILECADRGGTSANLPVSDNTCDGLTVQAQTIFVSSDGSFSDPDYTIYSLPSSILGEPSSESAKCNSTRACVLYVGQDYTDFTQPKVFSEPFYVGGSVRASKSSSALALALGGAAVVVVAAAGSALVYRRRRSRGASVHP